MYHQFPILFLHVCLLSHFSCIQLFAILWTVAHQAHLMAFSRQEYWSGLPFPPPGDLSDLGIKPIFLMSPVLASRFFTLAPPGKPSLFPAAAAAKSLQLCPTPCDPIDGSPPGSPVPGILQARTLEWVAISFSNV